MFRSLRQGGRIWSMSRLPLRYEERRQNSFHGDFQKVNIKPAGVKVRTVIFNVLAVYVGLAVFTKLVFGPLDKINPDDLPEEVEEEDPPPCIPFVGTTKQLQLVPYKGTDPEWKEFIKFSKDPQRAKKVREELANLVQQLAAKHPILTMKCGKEMKLRRFWLDVDFPPAPPPEFVRSCIEFPDDEWPRIATRKVDSLTVFRIRAAMWPSPIFLSTLSFLKVLVGDEYKRLASKLGISSSPPPLSMEQVLARHQQMMKNTPAPSPDGPPSQSPASGSGTKAITGPTAEESTLAEKGHEVEVRQPRTGMQIGVGMHTYLIRPMMAFRTKLAETWRLAPDYAPRGSILVSGLVEIDSPKAWLVFDVKAGYDPKERTWDRRSMKVKLRRYQLKRQAPPGGSGGPALPPTTSPPSASPPPVFPPPAVA